jgi:GTPase SAR1 family protein
VTSKSSLDEIEMWANIFNENKNGEGFIFFVGNKIDLENREVTEE